MIGKQGIAAAAVLGIALIANMSGCSQSASLGMGGKGVATARSRTIDHEPCDVDSTDAERVDANGDGQADLTVVKRGAVEVCRSADLDFDGRVDVWSYFDASGKLRRRELDYDRDGNIDEIQLFKAGEIAEKHRASTPAKRLDTWEFYMGGRLVRAERDSDANGRVDQWWDYKTPDCPIIRSDSDGNGEPDANTAVDYCAESGYKPPEQAAPTAAPMLQKETQALPTETSNRPGADAEGSKPTNTAPDNKTPDNKTPDNKTPDKEKSK
jgi:hypothetical protein